MKTIIGSISKYKDILIYLSLLNMHSFLHAKDRSECLVGAYYFGGWQSGPNYRLDSPNSLLLTPAFKNRKSLCGWFDDRQAVMDRELSWAALGSISFLAFLWYRPEAMSLEEDRLNFPLKCYQNSKSNMKRKVKYCIVYTNHDKFDIPPGNDWDRYSTLWIEWMNRDEYVKVSDRDGEPPKPLFIIWNPQRFHDHWEASPGGARKALEELRERAVKSGLPGVSVAGCCDQTSSMNIFREDGYDIITGYNFHGIGDGKAGELGHYDSLAKAHLSVWDSMTSVGIPVIPNITSGWDPRPWPSAAKASPYYPDRTPQKYMRFCQTAKDWVESHEEKVVSPKTILIYAWNELGEGGYILPTEGDRYAYLGAIKKIFGMKKPDKRKSRK